ncbi:MAG: hypothetical protein JOY54_20855 [Acidobacteriaceae bacterium]|nr:hypothetical protein [Acidobacteriaceae bacterium]
MSRSSAQYPGVTGDQANELGARFECEADTSEVSSHRRRFELAGICLLILLTIPARLIWIRASLWLDEAWVANAIQMPTIHQMLYYDRWAQSTPVLFMLLSRGIVAAAGASEVTLRVLPWVSSLLASFVLFLAVRRVLSFPLATCVITLVSADYWTIKYAQQAKQYDTDLLVSAIFMWIISAPGNPHPGARRILWICGVALALSFLSMPAMFWFPSIVLVLMFDTAERSGRLRTLFWPAVYRVLIPAAILAIGLAANYWFFARPNHLDIVTKDWSTSYHAYLTSNPLPATILRFIHSIGILFVPQVAAVGYFIVLLIAAGAVQCLRHPRDARSRTVALMGILPIIVAMATSSLRLYPMLDYPRLIVWMLPSAALLLCYSIEPVTRRASLVFGSRVLNRMVYAGCVLIIGGSYLAMSRHPAMEGNRQMFTHLKQSWRPGDYLFVHGGLSEQYALYARWLGWHPQKVYFGNTDWPCCSLMRESLATDPLARTLDEDVLSAVSKSRPGTLWMALPDRWPGSPWSEQTVRDVDTLPLFLSKLDCRLEEGDHYGSVMLQRYGCEALR